MDNGDQGTLAGAASRTAPAAQRAGKSGDKHTDSATPARSAARGILQHVYNVECVDMKTVSAGLLLGRAGDPSSCDRLPGSSQLWLVELAPITHLTAVIRPRIFSLGSQILCDSRQCRGSCTKYYYRDIAIGGMFVGGFQIHHRVRMQCLDCDCLIML